MKPEELFARAVAALPGAVRERLDGDFPVDWTVLEEAGTGADLGEAVRNGHRLPEPVETLVHRLVLDVGVVPADLAAGLEREGAAGAWIHWVTMASHGESYQLRNDRTGEIHAGIRPEAVAGYAVLGMELATSAHEALEGWLEAGAHHRDTAEDERSTLAQCAVRMHAHLQARSGTASGFPTTSSLARELELAWNSQRVEARAALAGVRLGARGARAPRASHYAPATGFRLHACDAGEIRWLRALAERAAAGARVGAAGSGPEEGARPAQAEGPAAGTSEAPSGTATLELGTAPDKLVPETEVAEFERMLNRVPEVVRARVGEARGVGVAEVLERCRNPRVVGALRRDIEPVSPGGRARAPRWLEQLAAALLMETGAQTRQGPRTAEMRLDPDPQSNGGYRAVDVATAAFGHLTAAGLVEQVRLGLAFAHDAWAGFTALHGAGKEGSWGLDEARTNGTRLSTGDREMLEAARDLGRTLDRIRRAHAEAHGQRPPSALERAAMAAQALEAVGPTVRTAAGWPGAAQTPNARDPEDVARVAAVAEGLHADIRRVANRLIAGRVAEVPPYAENHDA